MTGNVFPLNSETILIVEKARNGQEKIWKAYLAIAEDLREANHPDKDLIYWFENAAIINSNGEAYGQSKDASNTFIRAVTAAGLAINEKSPTKEGIQSTSDEIGRKVLKDVLNIGGVTNVAYSDRKRRIRTRRRPDTGKQTGAGRWEPDNCPLNKTKQRAGGK